jgi:hypothetical protein
LTSEFSVAAEQELTPASSSAFLKMQKVHVNPNPHGYGI